VTPAAQAVDCAELNEVTTITSHNFPLVNGRESRSHQFLGDARAGIYTCTRYMQADVHFKVRTLEVNAFFIEKA
jgi:hypothetical protein